MTQYHEGDEPVAGTGYRLVNFLGRGGFGDVWKAIAPGGAEVAIKFIRLGGAEGRKELRALQLVKRIRHPHLMPLNAFWLKSADGSVLDHNWAGATEPPSAGSTPLRATALAPAFPAPQAAELIIAMGLGDQSLFDRLQDCRAEGLPGIPREQLLEHMEDAARAIDFLNSPVHDQGSGPVGIQHGDIKPHNLMLVGGAVQVCDFGLARILGADRTSSAAATIAYAAPECLDPGQPSETTDQYSLAVTYCELRTGGLPYADESLAGVLRAKHDGQLDFSGLPLAEQAVLRRATAPAPADRFPTTQALVRALREATTSALRQPAAVVRPKPRYLSAATIVLLAVCGLAAGVAVWRRMPGREPRGDAPLAKVEIEDIAAPPRMNGAMAEVPASSVPPALSVEELLRRGTDLLEHERYAEAEAVFTQAAAQAAGDVRVFSRRGVARFHLARFQEAADDFGMAIQLAPDARDYVNRGRARLGLERTAEAEADFTAAIHRDPRNPAAFYYRSVVEQGRKSYAGAIADLSEAIALAAGSSPADFPLAKAYERRGLCQMVADQADLDAAERDFSEALRLHPEDPGSVHESRASVYDLKGQAEMAQADMQFAALYKQLQQKPDDPRAWGALAELLASCPQAKLRDPRRAVAAATRACEATRWKDAASLAALATAQASAGDLATAAQSAQKAIELENDPAVQARYRQRLKDLSGTTTTNGP